MSSRNEEEEPQFQKERIFFMENRENEYNSFNFQNVYPSSKLKDSQNNSGIWPLKNTTGVTTKRRNKEEEVQKDKKIGNNQNLSPNKRSKFEGTSMYSSGELRNSSFHFFSEEQPNIPSVDFLESYEKEDQRTLLIRNIPPTSENEVDRMFKEFDHVLEVKVIEGKEIKEILSDRKEEIGEKEKVALVIFKTIKGAVLCKKSLDGTIIEAKGEKRLLKAEFLMEDDVNNHESVHSEEEKKTIPIVSMTNRSQVMFQHPNLESSYPTSSSSQQLSKIPNQQMIYAPHPNSQINQQYSYQYPPPMMQFYRYPPYPVMQNPNYYGNGYIPNNRSYSAGYNHQVPYFYQNSIHSTNSIHNNINGQIIKKKSYPNLFVFHLPQNVDDEILHELFAEFGKIKSVKVIRNPENNSSKGYGFVMYYKYSSAEKAVNEMNGKQIGKKFLKVSFHDKNKQFSTRFSNNYYRSNKIWKRRKFKGVSFDDMQYKKEEE